MKKISHIILENGEKIMIPVFEIQNPNDLYDKYHAEIYLAMLECMTRMSNRGWATHACFAVEAKEDEFIFNLNRDNIQEHVDRCMAYFESIEEYETCAFIQTLKF